MPVTFGVKTSKPIYQMNLETRRKRAKNISHFMEPDLKAKAIELKSKSSNKNK